MNLYYNDELIAEGVDINSCDKPMFEHLNRVDPYREVYYLRCWGDDEVGYTLDYGSHTNFFYLRKEE